LDSAADRTRRLLQVVAAENDVLCVALADIDSMLDTGERASMR